MRILLDTNAITALMRGDSALAAQAKTASHIVVSVVVAGELLHGYRAGKRYEKNVTVLRRFLAQPFVELREVTFDTAEGFGRIQRELLRAGSPIPTNDVWIAAHAIECNAELWSYDRHFRNVPGIVWRNLG